MQLFVRGLTAAADAAICKKMFGSGNTTLIILNEESGLLIKGASETIKNEAKEQKGGFLRDLLGQEFRLENIDETRNYLIEEINRNELMSKKHKKVCTTLNYIEHFLILGSTLDVFPFLLFLLWSLFLYELQVLQ